MSDGPSETPEPGAVTEETSDDDPSSAVPESGPKHSPSEPGGAPGGHSAPPRDPLRTRLVELLGCEYPIVQTGMGWVSGANLTAATSAAGGFGILAAVTMTADQLRDAVHAVKDRTDAPFGVNLRAGQPDLNDRIRFVTDEGVRLVSFAGAPTKDAIAKIHDAGGIVMPTVGARRHAEKMVEWGVDAVIAQGAEGGGHTGTVPTSLLLPQVAGAVGAEIPVVGAGGFHSGQGLIAALAYGADGIAMGTRFLLSAESRVPDPIKDCYTDASVFDTVVTTALDGAPQRVIRTEMIDGLEKSSLVTRLPKAMRNALAFRKITGTSLRDLVDEGLSMRTQQELTWSQLAMAANAPMLIKAALVDGDASVGVLPTGQVTGVIGDHPPVAELIEVIVSEARSTLARLAS